MQESNHWKREPTLYLNIAKFSVTKGTYFYVNVVTARGQNIRPTSYQMGGVEFFDNFH